MSRPGAPDQKPAPLSYALDFPSRSDALAGVLGEFAPARLRERRRPSHRQTSDLCSPRRPPLKSKRPAEASEVMTVSMRCEKSTKVEQARGLERHKPERPGQARSAPGPVQSPTRITLENNEKFRPPPHAEKQFPRASGGGDGPSVERSLHQKQRNPFCHTGHNRPAKPLRSAPYGRELGMGIPPFAHRISAPLPAEAPISVKGPQNPIIPQAGRGNCRYPNEQSLRPHRTGPVSPIRRDSSGL